MMCTLVWVIGVFLMFKKCRIHEVMSSFSKKPSMIMRWNVKGCRFINLPLLNRLWLPRPHRAWSKSGGLGALDLLSRFAHTVPLVMTRVVWAGWFERTTQYTLDDIDWLYAFYWHQKTILVNVWSSCLETMLSHGKRRVQGFHEWMPPSLGCVQVASLPCVCTKLWCSRRLGPVETRLTKPETLPESASQIFKSYQTCCFSYFVALVVLNHGTGDELRTHFSPNQVFFFFHCGWGVLCYQTGRYGNWLGWLCGCTISQSVRGAQMVDPYSPLRRGTWGEHLRHGPLVPVTTPQCHAQIADVVLGLLLGTPWASGSGSCPLCSSPVWRWEG